MLMRVHNKEFKVSPGRFDFFWQGAAKGDWESDSCAIFDRFLDPEYSSIAPKTGQVAFASARPGRRFEVEPAIRQKENKLDRQCIFFR
jgi:hypothetical protein